MRNKTPGKKTHCWGAADNFIISWFDKPNRIKIRCYVIVENLKKTGDFYVVTKASPHTNSVRIFKVVTLNFAAHYYKLRRHGGKIP